MDFSSSVAAGSVSNVFLLVVFGIGAWVKSRLNKSDCHLNCGCLQCDSELAELDVLKQRLEQTQSTQHDLLADIQAQLGILRGRVDVREPGAMV